MQGVSYKHCLLSLFFILFLDKPSHLQTNLKFVRIFNSVLCYFVNVCDMCNIDSFSCFFYVQNIGFLIPVDHGFNVSCVRSDMLYFNVM